MLFCDCVQDYFKTYLILQRGYGVNTLASYRDTFRLLLAYLAETELDVKSARMEHVGRDRVNGFLEWLEASRGNSISTRNVRLAHLKSFANYILTLSPDDVGTCSAIMATPAKRCTAEPPDSLSRDEIACLLAIPGTDQGFGFEHARRGLSAGNTRDRQPCRVA
ncbi:MAG: site-specific integrase [Coriobacteriia bacterium]|nr:site-specific integrase [Coriobacteriia bacterium]